MRNLILAGVSAAALTLGGAGLALAAGNSANSANTNQPMNQGEMQNPSMANGSGAKGSTANGSEQNQDRNEVMQAQRKLQSEQLYRGSIDGIDGPQTQQALKQYQQKNNLQQTGKLDEQTEQKLGISENSGSSMPPASNGAQPHHNDMNGNGSSTNGSGNNSSGNNSRM